MNKKNLTNIGLFAKYNNKSIAKTFELLVSYLFKKKYNLFIEKNSSILLKNNKHTVIDRSALSSNCDLIIVVGGDGSILNAARAIIDSPIPILGINRGRLGFLADIPPKDFEKVLDKILLGDYLEEKRILLQVTIYTDDNIDLQHSALNDVVLYNANLARMIEFDVYINNQFVMHQRSDGLIIATPTGSTAYALSGGGPILTPNTRGFVLVPMFPHTLSSRPIVINYKDSIELHISKDNELVPKVSCDGQIHESLNLGQRLLIKAHPNELTLIHPKHYNYFAVLRQKLGWNPNLN